MSTDDPETPQVSPTRRMLLALHPRSVLAMADGQPPVLKQVVQFCLIIVYPAWVVGMAIALAFYGAGYAVLWVIFWPVRAWMKRNRPDDYAASQAK